MNKYLMRKFQFSETGAKGIFKAITASFIVCVLNMLPVVLLMFLGEELLLNMAHNKLLYVGGALATSVFLYIGLWVEYERMYNETYKESENLRLGIAKKFQKLPLSYFSKHDLSDLAQTIMSDVNGIEHAMAHAIPKVYAIFIFVPIMGFMLIVGNVKMGLAVILPNILRLGILFLYRKKDLQGNEKYYKIMRENSEKFQEAIEMQEEIKAYNLNEKIKNELYKQMEHSEKVHLKLENTTISIFALSNMFSFVSLALVLLVGTSLFISKDINILYLLGYLLAAIKIKEILDISSETMFEVLYIAPRVARIKDIKETSEQAGKAQELKRFDVELKNVSFSYDKDAPVLNDISFTAEQGKVTALVGTSGCGKSTLLKLISRLYDYDKGEILIDGQNIKNISTASLYEKTSIVFQDVTLFNNSVMENIRIGRLDASNEEVIKAAELANCMDFIKKLPDGVNTFIGENGAELSGGERQRLSIARAFLKNAPILILDEISASLDVENERAIQESLNKLIKNKTVIIISHRLKSIENVDKIVVLKDGFVESQGSHKYLLEKSKTYKNLNLKTNMAEKFTY